MPDDIQEILEQKIADGQQETTIDTYYDVSDRVARELGDLFITHRNEVTEILKEMAGPEEVIGDTREALLATMCRDLSLIYSGDKEAIRKELRGHFARNVLGDLAELYPELPTHESGFLPDFKVDPFATEAFERSVELKAKARLKPFDSDIERERAIDWAKDEATVAAAERLYPIGTKIRLGDSVVRIRTYSIDLARDLPILVRFSSADPSDGDAMSDDEDDDFDNIEPPMDVYEFEDAIISGNANRISE